MSDEPIDFQSRLEAARARRDAIKPPPPSPVVETPTTDEFTDTIDLGDDDSFSEERMELDRLIASVDILDAYDRWVGKKREEARGRREGIKVSCPTKGHRDSDPSAWVNLDKQLWHCGGCMVGGDIYHLANYHFGINYESDPAAFVELKKAMAFDLGWVAKVTLGGATILEPIEVIDDEPSDVVVSDFSGDDVSVDDVLHSDGETGAEVIPLATAIDAELAEDERGYPSLDWRDLVVEDTFLDKWMNATTTDDLPEEYYFWHGLTAIGLAMGKETHLEDQPYIYGNLFLCLMGASGIGKSRSTGYLNRILREALPYDHDESGSTGTLLVPPPGSAEALVDSFSKPLFEDEDSPKKVTGWGRIRGLVNFSELSLLIGRANRVGSGMKPVLMEFYDSAPIVEIKSRGHGHVRAFMPYCSAVTTSQPRALKELLTAGDVDSGFVNRWVFVTGQPKPLMSVRRGAGADLTAASEALKGLRMWSMLHKEISWSDAGYTAWDNYFTHAIEPMKIDEETVGLMTRIDLTLKKVMLLLCANEGLTEITPAIVGKAERIGRYLIASYNYVYGKIGLGAFEDIHVCLLEGMARGARVKKDRAYTMKELSVMARRMKQPTDLVVKVIKTMIEIGEVSECHSKGTRGPSAVRYRLQA